jgi:hypothetical protein
MVALRSSGPIFRTPPLAPQASRVLRRPPYRRKGCFHAKRIGPWRSVRTSKNLRQPFSAETFIQYRPSISHENICMPWWASERSMTHTSRARNTTPERRHSHRGQYRNSCHGHTFSLVPPHTSTRPLLDPQTDTTRPRATARSTLATLTRPTTTNITTIPPPETRRAYVTS